MRAAGRKARCGWLPLRRNISSSASGRAPFAQAMLAGYYYKPSGARGAEKSAVFCHAAVYPWGQCPHRFCAIPHGSTLPCGLVSFVRFLNETMSRLVADAPVKASAGCGAYHDYWVLD